jgi:hypothetical protein
LNGKIRFLPFSIQQVFACVGMNFVVGLSPSHSDTPASERWKGRMARRNCM